MSEEASAPESTSPVLMDIFYEIIQSPINLALIGVIALLVYKILQSHLGSKKVSTFVPEPELPRLRRDFTLQELRPFDGTGTDGRVLVAVNGSVYDVTKGKRFYGPGEIRDTCCVTEPDQASRAGAVIKTQQSHLRLDKD